MGGDRFWHTPPRRAGRCVIGGGRPIFPAFIFLYTLHISYGVKCTICGSELILESFYEQTRFDPGVDAFHSKWLW